MGWREQLRPASFRGVAFYVQGHEAQLGRRVALHEFPQRDIPYAEDMGRATRKLMVEAYVLGADYMVARDRLLAAVELGGAGVLVHPYLGELRVNVQTCALTESNSELGLARLRIEFVEAGAAKFPQSEVSGTASVAAAGAAATAAAQASFTARHVVAGRPSFVAAASASIFGSALSGVMGAVAKVRGVADQVAALQRDVDAARRDLTTLIYAPASAANALVGAVRNLVRSVASTPRDMLSLARTLYRFGSDLPALAATTTSRRSQATNQAELVQLVRVTAAAEGARAASLVQWQSYDEATAARDELLEVMDGLMLASGVDDTVYDTLRALRTVVVRDVAARGANLARLVQWTPAATQPMLAIAQRLYADAERSDELVARNGVRHPLFVAGAQPLEVLADA